jgi:cytochrome c
VADAPATTETVQAAVADPREAEVLPAQQYLDLPRFAAADLQRGERVFLQCRACHSLGEGEPHRPSGPNLWGMFGSPAAQREGFTYSEALKNAEIVWTPAALEEWLVRPSSFVPGNRMAFAGIRREEDRTNLIAYLLRETSPAASD